MKRDELIKLLQTYDNLEVKIYIDHLGYDILEQDVFACKDAIIINPD